MISIPTKASSTTMGRKTTCNGCGYVQESITSYYLDRKAWKSVHTLAFCQNRKMHQDVDLMMQHYFGKRISAIMDKMS